jgi:hypothetical protein
MENQPAAMRIRGGSVTSERLPLESRWSNRDMLSFDAPTGDSNERNGIENLSNSTKIKLLSPWRFSAVFEAMDSGKDGDFSPEELKGKVGQQQCWSVKFEFATSDYSKIESHPHSNSDRLRR